MHNYGGIKNARSDNLTLPWYNKSQWRHIERDGVSNERHLDCLLNHLFRRRSKRTPKLRVTGLCEGNPPVTSGFPHKRPVTRIKFHLMTSPCSRLMFSKMLLRVAYYAISITEGITFPCQKYWHCKCQIYIMWYNMKITYGLIKR